MLTGEAAEFCGRIAQLVRAPASHAGGPWFDSTCDHSGDATAMISLRSVDKVYRQGETVIHALLANRRSLPRAIVCANDQTALGVMHALARNGIKIPEEVAVTGFDDVPVARHLHPPLTTVRQPMLELGATAFDVLYSRISTGKGEPDVVLPVQLIVRESCGCTAQSPLGTTKDGN